MRASGETYMPTSYPSLYKSSRVRNLDIFPLPSVKGCIHRKFSMKQGIRSSPVHAHVVARFLYAWMRCLMEAGVSVAVKGLNFTKHVQSGRTSIIALSLALYPVGPSEYDPIMENILSIVLSFGFIETCLVWMMSRTSRYPVISSSECPSVPSSPPPVR